MCASPRIQRLRLRNSNAKSPSTEISFPAKQSVEHSLHRSHVRIEAKERSEILVVNIRMIRMHTNALLFLVRYDCCRELSYHEIGEPGFRGMSIDGTIIGRALLAILELVLVM